MKKNILGKVLLLIVIILVLGVGCEKKTSNEKEEKTADSKTKILTCTKLYPSDSKVYEARDVLMYKEGKLTEAVMTEKISFVKTVESYTKDQAETFFEKLKEVFEKEDCSLTYYNNVEALKDGAASCKRKVEGHYGYLITTFNVDVIGERDSFKTIEDAQDFHENSLFKCSIK